MNTHLSKKLKNGNDSHELDQSLESFEHGEGAIVKDQLGNEYLNMSLNTETSPSNEDSTSGDLMDKARRFLASLKAITDLYPVKVHAKGNRFNLFFHKKNPGSFREMKIYDDENAKWFYQSLLKEGVRFNSSPGGANCIAKEHTDKQLRLIIIAVQRALAFVYGYVDNM